MHPHVEAVMSLKGSHEALAALSDVLDDRIVHWGRQRPEYSAFCTKLHQWYPLESTAANFACEDPTRLRSCNHVCMRYMLNKCAAYDKERRYTEAQFRA